jgi:hypothetical protein
MNIKNTDSCEQVWLINITNFFTALARNQNRIHQLVQELKEVMCEADVIAHVSKI